MEDFELIQRLKKDIKYLDEIYSNHKNYTINFMKRMCSDFEILNDVYQDSIILLYEKSLDPSFTLTCSIQTYLNSVCRNQLLRLHAKKSNSLNISDEFEATITDCIEPINIKENKLTSIEISLLKMKETNSKCYEILKRYFYLNQSMDEIAVEMNYTNGDNVKNQKSRCQKKLKKLTINEHSKIEMN